MKTAESRSLHVASTLKYTDLYARLKTSCMRDIWWHLRNAELIEARKKQVEFYRNLLRGFRKGDLIFDVGANVGEKTDVFTRVGARVIAIEPDERNQQLLRGRFLKYRFSPKSVIVVGKAASDKTSIETMWIDGPGSALNTLSQKWVDALKGHKERFANTPDLLEFAEKRTVQTTTLEQLASEYGSPFFVKIDVEGYELTVLKGLRRPVPYLSYEVNLPEFRREGLQCLHILEGLTPEGEFNYASECDLGLTLPQWVKAQELAHIIDDCAKPSIEVFWRTPFCGGG
jgi:FkbM family methyltransferase